MSKQTGSNPKYVRVGKSLLVGERTLREQFTMESGRRLNRFDYVVLLALLVLYSLFAFTNLGSLNFPTTVWTAHAADENRILIVTFGQDVTLSKVRLNGNIANGTMDVFDDSAIDEEGRVDLESPLFTYEQEYGNMFRWKDQSVSTTTHLLVFYCKSGTISFNELAFYDASDNQLAAEVYEPTGSQACALDEQGTVPETPCYLDGMYFDEIYHGRTAYEIINNDNLKAAGGDVQADGYSIYEWTHPTLGKLFIALGIRIFGMTPFGWRFAGAFFGVLILAVLFVYGKRFFKRTSFALLTAALFTFDTMHFAQTRIATIDVYACFFTLLMFLFLYDYMVALFTGKKLWQRLLPLGLCGLSFGLGISSKWTCLYSGVGLAVLFFGAWIARLVLWIKDRVQKTNDGDRPIVPFNFLMLLPIAVLFGVAGLFAVAKKGVFSSGVLADWFDYKWYELFDVQHGEVKAIWIVLIALSVLALASDIALRIWVKRSPKREQIDMGLNDQFATLFYCCCFFLAVPFFLYYGTNYCYYLKAGYVGLHANGTPITFSERLGCLWNKQISMYNYHKNLTATHQCQSTWYQWPLAQKSVWFYSGAAPSGFLSHIVSTGNPALFYTTAVGAVCMLGYWFRERKLPIENAVIFVAILSGLLPWALVTRCVFQYHYFSTIPYMLLATVMLLYLLEQRYPKLYPLKWVWLGVVVLVFLFMYPAASGLPCTTGWAKFIENYIAVFGKVYYAGV